MDDPSAPDLTGRLERIYAAIGAIQPLSVSDFVRVSSELPGDHVEFRTKHSRAELENIVHSAVQNVASLRDHVIKWAVREGRARKDVVSRLDQCPHSSVVQDLCNNDKHGYPPRDGGSSGRKPYLADINYGVSMGVLPTESKSLAGVKPVDSGPLRARKVVAVVSGLIVDGEGEPIGDLHEWLLRSTSEIEEALIEFGVAEISHTPQELIPRYGFRLLGIAVEVTYNEGATEVLRPRQAEDGP